MRRTLPWLVSAIVVVGTAYGLQSQGRAWWCSCGYFLLWSGEPASSDTSQHLLDPYSPTHVLHGFVLCGLLAWVGASLPPSWRLQVAVAIEALWELVENSEFVIRRYREGTAALGYEGDAIVNSLGDLAVCGLGFLLAYHLGARRAIALFLLTEVVLLAWIRDSLLLNVLMLMYPIDAIKEWQMGL
ncbi:MAG: DUF2585 domain-containing protein [Actinomycetota bacterium]|nr:DUF2585 domain-containing protein [Actinomycetota bacterium]MDP9487563.1 DUF2585 domain-containing protein [Actinomycetota bacterium]